MLRCVEYQHIGKEGLKIVNVLRAYAVHCIPIP